MIEIYFNELILIFNYFSYLKFQKLSSNNKQIHPP